MGSPTIVADILSPGATSQLAARLLDVDPSSNTETLVARGLYRPEINTAATRQVFQLHPNGWLFAAGHVAKLELLPADQPYARNSNGQTPITVANLELRLPVLDPPGCGLVQDPAPKVVPSGYALAPDFVTTALACGHCPIATCRGPVAPASGSLTIKDKPATNADRVLWKWKGAATTKAEYGNPLATTDYALCVYDGASTLVTSAQAPAGGTCAGRPCWKETSTGWKYRDKTVSGTTHTSLQIALKEGAAGSAKIGVTGKGGTPPVPPLPLAQPARVQLVNGDGTCWEATYGAPAALNDGVTFKDKSD